MSGLRRTGWWPGVGNLWFFVKDLRPTCDSKKDHVKGNSIHQTDKGHGPRWWQINDNTTKSGICGYHTFSTLLKTEYSVFLTSFFFCQRYPHVSLTFTDPFSATHQRSLSDDKRHIRYSVGTTVLQVPPHVSGSSLRVACKDLPVYRRGTFLLLPRSVPSVSTTS